ncbi:hypothetical protein BV898_14641 [Hypsibius exemplaris]|uniref:Uncharacterized protein n=1 Tax=Hypsibius exemplaris TaxID=2072580 RepID=A0A9X6NCB0_HYPEX|nr:hypothetical protein BV898_14641 [Hypsibius exemplaris]
MQGWCSVVETREAGGATALRFIFLCGPPRRHDDEKLCCWLVECRHIRGATSVSEELYNNHTTMPTTPAQRQMTTGTPVPTTFERRVP